MNWFKRYGISGAYFLLFILWWSIVIFNITSINNQITKEQKEFIGWLFVFSFLPIGYLITIIQQALFYMGLSGYRMHKNVVDNLQLELKRRYNLDNTYCDEAKSEAILTCRIRLDEANDLERLKYLAGFATRRFDVISINNSIIMSTFLAPLFAGLIPFFLVKKYSVPEYCSMRILVIIGMSALIILFLMISNYKMYLQIKIVNEEILKKKWKLKEEKIC